MQCCMCHSVDLSPIKQRLQRVQIRKHHYIHLELHRLVITSFIMCKFQDVPVLVLFLASLV